MVIDERMRWILGGTVVVYFVVMYAVSWFASRRIHDVEDYAVAGRRLPLSLAWMTLLATWFGAATMLIVPDEIRKEGLVAAALDPIGAGLCLILAGFLVAGPMWREKLLTVPDLFRKRFGRAAEVLAAIIMVPSYFGWIAAQFVALAGMARLFFGIDPVIGLVAVAILGTGYTLLGGMWSVTLTDAIQIGLLLIGLVVMAFVVAGELGGWGTAWTRIVNETSPDKLVVVPLDSTKEFFAWLALLAAGALGNMPGQDLMQRVFAARSESVARKSCYIAGTVYLAFGLIPVFIALAANLLVPDSVEGDLMPALAAMFLHPVVAVIFVVALMSAVLSTIDSAILAPATVLAQNLLARRGQSARSLLWLNRACVLLVAALSLALALAGDSAWSLLEDAYSITLVGLFVPMMFGLYSRPGSAAPALASMIAGAGTWLVHYVSGWDDFLEPFAPVGRLELPLALACTLLSLVAWLVTRYLAPDSPGRNVS